MRVKITEAFRQKIRDEIERTGVGVHAVLRGRQDKPEGFNSTTIRAVTDGRGDTLSKEFHDYIDTLWDNAAVLIDLTPAMSDHLKAEMKRTSMGLNRFLKLIPEVPDGLTLGQLYHWTERRVQKVRKDHYDAVIDFYATLPTVEPRQKPQRPKRVYKPPAAKKKKPIALRENYVPISKQQLAALRAERDRTMLGGDKLMAHAENPPSGLHGSTVKGWLSEGIKSAPQESIDYVLDLYKRQITRKKYT